MRNTLCNGEGITHEEGMPYGNSIVKAKETVTYDSSTGKMYEELGSSGSGEVMMGHNHVIKSRC